MNRKLYEHERHPLDVAAEEEAKTQEKQQKKISSIVQEKMSSPKDNWNLSHLEYEVALHLGREYVYSGNKLREKAGWPVTRMEMIKFLDEHGLKQ